MYELNIYTGIRLLRAMSSTIACAFVSSWIENEKWLSEKCMLESPLMDHFVWHSKAQTKIIIYCEQCLVRVHIDACHWSKTNDYNNVWVLVGLCLMRQAMFVKCLTLDEPNSPSWMSTTTLRATLPGQIHGRQNVSASQNSIRSNKLIDIPTIASNKIENCNLSKTGKTKNGMDSKRVATKVIYIQNILFCDLISWLLVV